MASYGYIIMIIAVSCIIWFHLDCIMQLNKSYYIATNVCSRKSATTFGDLPDCCYMQLFKHLPHDFYFSERCVSIDNPLND